MNFLKKIIPIIIIVSLSLTLTGCPSKASTKVGEATKETTIETKEKTTEESIKETTEKITNKELTHETSEEQETRQTNMEIYVMDTDGSEQINLTNNNENDWFPTWSPDGKKLPFSLIAMVTNKYM